MPLKYTGRFQQQYLKLPLAVRAKVDKALRMLEANFRHPGLRSHPVESAAGIFEAYVDKKYRMTFERQNDALIMRNVDNHDECLKNP
jgi:hypothetical protein